METVLQDLTYAWRRLLADRASTLVVVVSLALGIGANTAAYTLVHAALLQALPVPNPERLVELTVYDASGERSNNYGYPLYRELRDALGPFAATAAVYPPRLNRISLDGAPVERAVVEAVSGNYFEMLQLKADAGRLLAEADDNLTGGQAVAVLSRGYRDRRFGARAEVVGRTVTIEEKPYAIVGVVAGAFEGVDAQSPTDVWVPIATALPLRWLTSNGSRIFSYVARLVPDRDPVQAGAAAELVYRRYLEQELLPSQRDAAGRAMYESTHLGLRPAAAGLASLGRAYRRPLTIVTGFVVIILLLCCANVANLMLARQQARRQEFALRLSLGAGPGRLARQLLTESLLLGLAGAFAGLVVAYWCGPLIVHLLPERRIPVSLDLTPDARVFAFTAILGLLSAIVIGLVPARRAAATDGRLTLSAYTRGITRAPLGRVLAVVQLAGSLVLLVTALLMARTLWNLNDVDLGFRPHELLTFEVSVPSTYSNAVKAALYDRIISRLAATPDVVGVTYSRESVYSAGGWAGAARLPDEPRGSDRQVCLMRVGPNFFDTVGIARAGGRVFEADDHRAARRVTVINETMARQFFGSTPAVGRLLFMSAEQSAEYEVVGVVPDVKHYGARERACGGRAAYVPADSAAPAGAFMVRTTIPTADLRRIVQDEIGPSGAGILLERLRPIDADVANLLARERMVERLAVGFALLALAIAAVGLYGVMAYGVGQRTNEIGLRAALGARPAMLMRMVLREAFLLVAAGIVFGLPAAIAATRMLGNLLFGIAATDVPTFAAAAIVLSTSGAIAAWLPARRAAAIDPLVAMRTLE